MRWLVRSAGSPVRVVESRAGCFLGWSLTAPGVGRFADDCAGLRCQVAVLQREHYHHQHRHPSAVAVAQATQLSEMHTGG